MLHVHRSADADVLVEGLAALLGTAVEDVFAAEIVAVPAKGVERWLAQRLSHVLGAGGGGAGVCANVLFPAPGPLLDEALAAALPESAGAGNPWDPERAVWPLLTVLDGADERLARRLAEGDRRFPAAARLAATFARYGRERPGMLADWAAGREDTEADPLPPDLRWQPRVWRMLRERIGVPSPAEQLPAALARLRAQPELAALPERFSVYGANRLSTSRLHVLAALAAHRDVHLWVNHASPALWAAVTEGRKGRHPLLVSLSRDVQAFQRRLLAVAPDLVDHVHPAPPRPDTLLGRLQVALALDTVPATAPLLDPADTSVAFHACHGRTRQVEVLREVVLARLAADPSLQPRDIVVMCPDVEEFAPLIAAAFGGAVDAEEHAALAHPAAALAVRLADRAAHSANPLFAVAATLLRLAGGRVTVPDVLDLASAPAVRRRFGFDDDDVARLRGWVADARICWGLDGPHRARYKLSNTAQGTWRDGLDRLLLGAAMEDGSGWLADAVPLDDVDSADLDLVGRFAEFVDRVHAAVLAFTPAQPVSAWTRLLADAEIAVAAPLEPWQGAAFSTEVAEVAEAADGSGVELSLADMTALWAARASGRPTRSGFRTGTLTVCTLVPMRSVPHRVVVLLGLDDGAFPRAGVVDGDDLLARAPRDGERDPRAEDRQLLLDAIGAAGEHLIVLYTGADERTGLPVPPAVPLGELADALDTVARLPDGGRVRAAVTVRHPLQPFDPRNFGVGDHDDIRRCVSFDPAALAGARAMLAERRPRPRLVAGPLPALPAADVELDDLRGMLIAPARGFLEQRLGIRLSTEDPEPPATLPVELKGLAEWEIGDRFLAARLRDVPPGHCIAIEQRRGALPPGVLGEREAKRIGSTAEAVAVLARPYLAAAADNVDVDVDLRVAGLPRTLRGTVGGVRGDTVLRVSYSKVAAKHLLGAWVDLLALTVSRPGRAWQAVVAGRDRNDACRRVFGPISAEVATGALAELIGLVDEGRRAPLPLPVNTAHAHALAVHRGLNPQAALAAAEREWRTRWGGEVVEDAHLLVWGPDATLADLGIARLATLAAALWAPVFAAERRGSA
jgi:exodeoxyribonuclease V gamma subunit